MATVITIVNYDHTVVMIINYNPKTFIVQATGLALGQRLGFLKSVNNIADLESCNKLKTSKGRTSLY